MKMCLLLCFAATVSALHAEPAAAARPNIIVILADDMGFSDIGCYGSEIPTPNLDALAAKGVRFSQFYNTGRCCPTRASLLTGLYAHQAGIGHMNDDERLPGYRGFLTDNTVTLAEPLAQAGYLTAMTGKWHVGHDADQKPSARGFQRSLSMPAGGVYYPDSKRCNLHLNGEPIGPRDERLPKDWYSSDLFAEFGIRFIDEARKEQKPFFLYLAYVAPHFPLQADKADIDRFRGKYKEGWDALSAKRLAKQREMGLIDPSWSPAPRPDKIAAWDSLDDEKKDRFDHMMATYAAVVSRLDRSVGTLVAALKERDAFDNTLILFMSDNGGNAEAGPNGRTEGDPTKADSDWFCGQSWAHLQNTPFRLYKHHNHEGGIASPLVAHWPAGIKESRWVRAPAHVIDILPTCLDFAAGNYPESRNGKPVTPLEGVSLKPLLTGAGSLAPRPLFWEHEGNAAVRQGDLKLVRKGNRGPWELYDLKADRTELNDLAAARPEKVKELLALWRSWAKRANVQPKPGAREGESPDPRR
jgi:arylsulfatase A-like enzyme